MAQLVGAQQAMLGARIRDIVEQLQELKSLRGKNQSVIAHMMRRIDIEKKEFDGSLFKLQGTRSVFARLSTELFTTLGMDAVQQEIDAVRDAMEASRFATGMRAPVKHFFDQAQRQPRPVGPQDRRDQRDDGIDVPQILGRARPGAVAADAASRSTNTAPRSTPSKRSTRSSSAPRPCS